ncbi:septal ring lytic transglycosylase RlpA family protein [Ramlibacter alkalitolerans]|uniref:Endolytic peptidoglycan transglycosylase RlpA n=1 Tax=Ramlibacter alkalitolerans TaxID=2039631 RepID=A0ABS1JJV1_9BURK|nr:septal ring lytic transglycosylase RlpA family protein [Ramlibacter alkalitolerans]MBL0424095.1 septal ring lytic transglycosylase RlpA family protein [Ramlibacter alkalitolerans]
MAVSPVASQRSLPVRGAARLLPALLLALFVAGCSTTPDGSRPGPDPGAVTRPAEGTGPEPGAVTKPAEAELGRGRASWYGPGFHGKRTASGERFDMNALTAAHRSLPFGTRVRVRNAQNGREVVVRINDRGPWIAERIIDVSKAAAVALGLLQAGEAPVVLFGL